MLAFIQNIRGRFEGRTSKYNRWLSPISFGFGFVLDLFTLNRIDQKVDLGILLTHLTLATGWITIWHIRRSRLRKFQKWKKVREWAKNIAPAAMQFSFGALFSGFVIFYTKSSSLLISWPFLIILYLLFLGNESFRKFYRGLFFQVGVLYFSILTILIFLVPLWLNDIGPVVFLLSGLVSLLVIGVIFRVMVYYLRSVNALDHKRLWLWVFMIFMGVNLLYYENLIPAVPLSLKADGLYYHIERSDDGYLAFGREQTFWEGFLPPERIEKPDKEWIYYYSAIFAPNNFEQKIIHEWQYYDERKNQWKTVFAQPLQVIGGRAGGYRGYSYLIDPAYGSWRVLSKTENKQILGQKKFEVIAPVEAEKIQMKTVEL